MAVPVVAVFFLIHCLHVADEKHAEKQVRVTHIRFWSSDYMK